MLSPTRAITLVEARTIIRRAVDKAEELHQVGSFVVVDDAGNVVSASRMDGAGPVGMPISRAKAYIAGANREPSARFAQRVGSRFVGIYMAYAAVLRDSVFPGPGALPIVMGGQVVGGFSTGASIGPYLKFEGIEPRRFLVNGQAANAEDLIICYALRVPYQPQHGDDAKRFAEAYGFPPSEAGESLGFAEPPPASRSPALQQAARLADRAMQRARTLGARVAITVTDRHGEILQQDRMDGAAPMTPDVSAAKAATAVNFRRDTAEVADLTRQYPELMHLGQAAHFSCSPWRAGCRSSPAMTSTPRRRERRYAGARSRHCRRSTSGGQRMLATPVREGGRAGTRQPYEDFQHTGPGTLAGRYMRLFWQPVFLSRKLEPGRAVPIRIMSEDFTLYRGENGEPHCVDLRCAHRATVLNAGWVEGDCIRCPDLRPTSAACRTSSQPGPPGYGRLGRGHYRNRGPWPRRHSPQPI